MYWSAGGEGIVKWQIRPNTLKIVQSYSNFSQDTQFTQQ